MDQDSDDENLVIGVAELEPQGAEGGGSPLPPPLASAVMPPEMYETEWEAFQLSIQSPVGEPDLLDLNDLGSDSTVFYQKNLPNLGFPQMEDIRRQGKLCDVNLRVGEHVFSAHRIVLAATIPYFRCMR